MKRVRFCKKQTYHYYPDADSEYRKPYWMFVALDRMRFKDRIKRTENKIGYIFSEKHRQKIIKEIE